MAAVAVAARRCAPHKKPISCADDSWVCLCTHRNQASHPTSLLPNGTQHLDTGQSIQNEGLPAHRAERPGRPLRGSPRHVPAALGRRCGQGVHVRAAASVQQPDHERGERRHQVQRWRHQGGFRKVCRQARLDRHGGDAPGAYWSRRNTGFWGNTLTCFGWTIATRRSEVCQRGHRRSSLRACQCLSEQSQ